MAHYGTNINDIPKLGRYFEIAHNKVNILTLSLAVNFVALDGCIGVYEHNSVLCDHWILLLNIHLIPVIVLGREKIPPNFCNYIYLVYYFVLLCNHLMHTPLASLLAFWCSWMFRTLKWQSVQL